MRADRQRQHRSLRALPRDLWDRPPAQRLAHVDSAFGLGATATPSLRHLLDGVDLADSWATDTHKWLTVPYDCGIVLCAHPDSHPATVTLSAAYLTRPGSRDGTEWTPESPRRARAFAVWAGQALSAHGDRFTLRSSCGRPTVTALAVSASWCRPGGHQGAGGASLEVTSAFMPSRRIARKLGVSRTDDTKGHPPGSDITGQGRRRGGHRSRWGRCRRQRRSPPGGGPGWHNSSGR